MIEIKAISYEEARMEFFIQQREAAARRIKYWSKKAHRASMTSYVQNKAADAGWEWNFYNDVIGLLGGPKEETE